MTQTFEATANTMSLAHIVTAQGLCDSWYAAQSRHPRPGTDGVTVQHYAKNLEQNLQQLLAQVLSGAYQAKPAYRIWLAKQSGGERGVIALCLEDRIVQGAVLRTLGQRLGKVMSQASFAYREGLGALRAAHRVLEQRDAGRIWVVRGDIETCFDSIPHEGVLAMLQAYLAPDALELLRRLLRTPVRDGQSISTPEIGLPQGALISPLLANLYLTPFDRTVDQAPAALVRFADDFALLAPTAGGVGASLERGEHILGQLRLRLHAKKTRIVSFEQGFDFLGFHFQHRNVRVAPERILEFKAHLEHLCAPKIGNPQPGHIKQANDAIKGWRAYFRLGNISEDFLMLDQWMKDRFGKTAELLEPLLLKTRSPHAPELGGYTPRSYKQTKISAQIAPTQPKVVAQAPTSITRDIGGVPLTAFGLRVADHPPLPVPHHVQAGLEQAALYHKAVVCNQWQSPSSPEAAVQLTLAARGHISPQNAQALYEKALTEQHSLDLRSARGQLRRALRLEAWTALLQVGWHIGMDETGSLPRLAVLLANALEPFIVDVALLAASKANALHKPGSYLEKRLIQSVRYRSTTNTTWQTVLQQEASRLHLPNNKIWLWGTA